MSAALTRGSRAPSRYTILVQNHGLVANVASSSEIIQANSNCIAGSDTSRRGRGWTRQERCPSLMHVADELTRLRDLADVAIVEGCM